MIQRSNIFFVKKTNLVKNPETPEKMIGRSKEIRVTLVTEVSEASSQTQQFQKLTEYRITSEDSIEVKSNRRNLFKHRHFQSIWEYREENSEQKWSITEQKILDSTCQNKY